MLVLQKNNIIDLYVWVDDNFPKTGLTKVGRHSLLNGNDVVTILIWNAITMKQKTLKDIYEWIRIDYSDEFPRLPCYENFVKQCHRVLPLLITILNNLLSNQEPIRIMDSTMLEVCKLVRADRHKTCKNIAQFGKNHQGWHYGFKLHTSVNLQGKLCAIFFTPASYHDAQAMPEILNQYAKVAVGDGGYTASVMKKRIWETYGTFVVSPPHFKQNKKLITWWQYKLLTIRPKIETVFDYLKEHMHLVSSFPRSVAGYLLHYVRILLGYQIMANS
jgi:hypothetical protein